MRDANNTESNGEPGGVAASNQNARCTCARALSRELHALDRRFHGRTGEGLMANYAP
jgi:hypothetical protein